MKTNDSRDEQNTRRVEAVQSARRASLRYVHDELPGYTRRRQGRGFAFLDEQGNYVRDPEVRARLKELVIPPAWTEVWICQDPDGHLQVTGRDDAGRKQYIYHPRWSEARGRTKYAQLVDFAEHLPAIRACCDRDMRLPRLCRARMLGLAVTLLDRTLIRIGNETYTREHDSHGLTTLTPEHVDVSSTTVILDFNGKSGQHRHVMLRDRRLARQIQRSLELPGYALFSYLDDDGEARAIDGGDVNQYLQNCTGSSYTAKYFRTWGGTLAATRSLLEQPVPTKDAEAERAIKTAIKATASALGNTVAVARKYYIHPAVFEAARDGSLWKRHEKFTAVHAAAGGGEAAGLSVEERFVLALIRG